MKFGQILHRYQVVEWLSFYIDYRALKKLYKFVALAAIGRGESDEGARSDVASSPALIPDSEGLTALHLAVRAGNAPATEILLKDYYLSIDASTGTDAAQVGLLPTNLLTTALRLNNFAIVQLLLMSTIDINHKDHNNETALYLAIRSGRL